MSDIDFEDSPDFCAWRDGIEESVYRLVRKINQSQHGILITHGNALQLVNNLPYFKYEFSFGRLSAGRDEPKSAQFYSINALLDVKSVFGPRYIFLEQTKYEDEQECAIYYNEAVDRLPKSEQVMDTFTSDWIRESHTNYVRDLYAIGCVRVVPRGIPIEVAAHTGSYLKALQLVNFINTSLSGVTLITWNDARLLFGELGDTDMRFTPCESNSYIVRPHFIIFSRSNSCFGMKAIVDIGEFPGTQDCVVVQKVSDIEGVRTVVYPTDDDIMDVSLTTDVKTLDCHWEWGEDGVLERRLYAIHSIENAE